MIADVKVAESTLPAIKLCYNEEMLEGEMFISDHMFIYIVSGICEVWLGGTPHTFKSGDFRFLRRNQVSKYVRRPDGGIYKSISVTIDQKILKQVSVEYGFTASTSKTESDVFVFPSDKYLDRYVESVEPYVEDKNDRYEEITALKIKELILLLIQKNPSLKSILFDFSDPGKLNLEAFMNMHYRYNVGLNHLAFLSGRSLSGFKRDFAKQFRSSPNKWLIQKRLEEARYLIEKKDMKPAEIYLELGFKDLSHFSFAYKKAFGNPPTKTQTEIK
jgi:AraC-like DNA-binding protein